nr:flavodoxin [uncultured Holophaga sp.]
MSDNLILFGSTLGDTERIAARLAELLPGTTRVAPIRGFPLATLPDYDLLLLGTSTWGAGDIQDDWEGALAGLRKLDLDGRSVALFGLGDAYGYADTFVDGMGILHETLTGTRATRKGFWPTEGYPFSHSRAVVDGHFVGLPLDENNQSHLTEDRLLSWVSSL